MKVRIEDTDHDVLIERKKTNKNTYLRVREDLSILVTTNFHTSEKKLQQIIMEHEDAICKMIKRQINKNQREESFYYLGKRYDVIYSESFDIMLGENKVFLNRHSNLDKWYKKQAQVVFLEHLDRIYHQFSEKIPYPKLKIRKMTSRWGVCNVRDKIVTLNLELIKRDSKYLDYVIVHELSHLVYANHSKSFWEIVEKNVPNYKILRKEMKEY